MMSITREREQSSNVVQDIESSGITKIPAGYLGYNSIAEVSARRNNICTHIKL